MIADPFQREMIRHQLQPSPAMTLKGTVITLALIATLIYAAIDCGIF